MGILDIAANLVGTGVNAVVTGAQNRKTRKHQEHMYDRQMSDTWSLWNAQNLYDKEKWQQENEYMEGLWNKQNEYNERMWQTMNDYNSPQAQMARYGAAGLNPNLIYGQSNTAQPMDIGKLEYQNQEGGKMGGPPSPGNWNPRPLDLNIGSSLAMAAQTANTRAQTNNLEQLNRNIQLDGDLKILEATGKAAENQHKVKDYAQSESLYDMQADGLKLLNQQRAQDIAIGKAAELRNQQAHVQNMEQMKATINNLGLQNKILNLNEKLLILDGVIKQQNINWNEVNPVRIIPLMMKTPIKKMKEGFEWMISNPGTPGFLKSGY